MPRLTLIGYRGTGKSTVAALVARRLRCTWQDADAVLEEKLGCTIAALVQGRGEPAFRDAEADLLAELLKPGDGVLSTGGGVVLRPANRLLLKRLGRPVVWLTAPAEVVRGRLAADPTTLARRPALSGGDPLDEVAAALVAREPLYRECADVAFDTGGEGAEAVVDRIIDWLGRSPPAAAQVEAEG